MFLSRTEKMGDDIQGSVETVPKDLRQLRACLVCSLVKTFDQVSSGLRGILFPSTQTEKYFPLHPAFLIVNNSLNN